MIYFQRRIYFTKVNIVWFGCFELFFICHGIVQYVLRIRPFIDRVQIRLYPAPDSSVSGSRFVYIRLQIRLYPAPDSSVSGSRFVYIRLQIRLYPAPDSSVSGSRSACIRLKIRIWLIYIIHTVLFSLRILRKKIKCNGHKILQWKKRLCNVSSLFYEKC